MGFWKNLFKEESPPKIIKNPRDSERELVNKLVDKIIQKVKDNNKVYKCEYFPKRDSFENSRWSYKFNLDDKSIVVDNEINNYDYLSSYWLSLDGHLYLTDRRLFDFLDERYHNKIQKNKNKELEKLIESL